MDVNTRCHWTEMLPCWHKHVNTQVNSIYCNNLGSKCWDQTLGCAAGFGHLSLCQSMLGDLVHYAKGLPVFDAVPPHLLRWDTNNIQVCPFTFSAVSYCGYSPVSDFLTSPFYLMSIKWVKFCFSGHMVPYSECPICACLYLIPK